MPLEHRIAIQQFSFAIDDATYPVVVSPSGDFSVPNGPTTTDRIAAKSRMKIADCDHLSLSISCQSVIFTLCAGWSKDL